jgi:hypothetical protein
VAVVRIETAWPEQVLHELPRRLVHTCITVPPKDELETLDVLRIVRPVLREDGTVWLLQKRSAQFIPDLLAALGWHEHPVPDPIARTARECTRRVLLLTRTRKPKLVLPTRPTGRQRACVPQPLRLRGHDDLRCAYTARFDLVRACLKAASTTTVCVMCGEPPTTTGLLRCGHSRANGRAVVLDPFYRPSSQTAHVALACGQSFLGITSPTRQTSI